MTDFDFIRDFYVQQAWADGDKALQDGRWPYVDKRLDELQKENPGIRGAVMAALKAKRGEAVTPS